MVKNKNNFLVKILNDLNIFSALNSFSICVMNPIRRYCGASAWQVIFRVLKDTTQTLMPTCYFKNLNTINNSDNFNSSPIELIKSNNKLNEDLTKNNRQADIHQHHHRKQIYYSTNYPDFYNNKNKNEKTTILPFTTQQKLLNQQDFKQQKNLETQKYIGILFFKIKFI